MKKLLVIAMLICSIPAMAQVRSVSLTASGLTCSMCSKAIYKALLKVPSVKEVQADVETSKYSISFKERSNISFDELKKAVTDAGFSVAAMQVTAIFNNVSIANDTHVKLFGNNLHFVKVDKQVLDGEKTLTVIDKNFLPEKDHKAYGKYTVMKCYTTGYMQPCCSKTASSKDRIYHVSL